MFERETTLYRFNLNYLRLQAAEIDEAEMSAAPFPGANSPVWIMGHLAVATDFAGKCLGLKPECPAEWHAMFAPGTLPANLKPPLPTKSDLLAAIERGHKRVSEAAPSANPEIMNTPHNVALLKPTVLKTIGDVLGHLMCTHEAYHLAQLSACRRKAGKPLIV